MPFTPFHFGPSFCIALYFDRHIDLPVFLLANVVIDFEPLILMQLKEYPIHSYCHTLLFSTFLGLCFGIIGYWGKGIFQRFMAYLQLDYQTNLSKMIKSAIWGMWFHVLLDILLHHDIRPFYPLELNVAGAVSGRTVYWACAVAFIPAIILYMLKAKIRR